METIIDPEKIIRLTENYGASESEVYIEKTRTTEITAKMDNISEATSSETTTIGIRVAIGKKIGASGGIVSKWEDVEKIIKHAIINAKNAVPDEKWPGFNPNIRVANAKPKLFDNAIRDIDVEHIVSILSDQIKLITSYENIHVAEASIDVGVEETIYANSYGGPLSERSTLLYYGLEIKKTGLESGTFYDYIYRVRLEEEKIRATTENSISKVLDASKAKTVETFTGDIVIDREEASSLIRIMLGSAISAEQAQQKRSPLIGRIGEKILDERITIIDNPFLDWEPGSSTFDDEGHPTLEKAIFEKGVFKTFLYDYYTARIEKRDSTGNASRMKPWSKPTPSPTNLIVEVESSKKDLEQLVASIKKGVLVVRTIGSWMSNPISGQVNMTISFGYLIENGSLTKPVKGLVVADDFYKALSERLLGAGGILECHRGVCSRSIAWSGVTFAGKK